MINVAYQPKVGKRSGRQAEALGFLDHNKTPTSKVGFIILNIYYVDA